MDEEGPAEQADARQRPLSQGHPLAADPGRRPPGRAAHPAAAGVDPDLWLHLRLGEQLRAGERFQRLPDPLVVLADQPYSPTQWLAEVGMSVVHEVSGVAGIHVVRALAVVALLAFLQLTAVVYTTPVRAAGVALPAFVASAAQWGNGRSWSAWCSSRRRPGCGRELVATPRCRGRSSR